MPSLIPGFEYDVFISYRQKDNRGEQWVTEFIQALKTELETTIKEDVSIYFDENPHDGLLEIYNVDKSLENKLKCVIFIPILSQTYCDPKSFAWNSEFLAFIRRAAVNPPGLDIKLMSGNVASRVLPVRIHEIDDQDQLTLENELKGKIRSVDFIYHTAGVNRPLRPDDDKVRDNEYKTVYRNQINKVANAIKEILYSIKTPSPDKIIPNPQQQIPGRQIKMKFGLLMAFLIVLVAVLSYVIYNSISKTNSSSADRTIAVLPFENISSDPGQEYISIGMMEEIINQLSKVKALQVTSRTSSMKYKASPESLRDIARELGVAHIIEGSVRTSGSQIRIAVQLIDAQTDKHLWSETYDKPMDINSLMAVQTEVALQISRQLNTILTPGEEQALQQIPTKNLEAYQLYLRARQVSQDREMEHILQSIAFINQTLELDPDFTLAKLELANDYLIYKDWDYPESEDFYEKAEKLAEEVIKEDPTQALAYSILSSVDLGRGRFREFRTHLNRAVENNPADVEILHRSAGSFAMLGEQQKALVLIEKALKSDPFSPIVNHNYLRVLLYNRSYGEAAARFKGIMDRIPDNSPLKRNILEQYQFETGKCDSLQSPYNKTLCFTIRGQKDKAREELNSLHFGETLEGTVLQSYFKALVDGDADALFATLHNMWATEKLRPSLSYLKTDPVYDPFRSDPRYNRFLKAIGLMD